MHTTMSRAFSAATTIHRRPGANRSAHPQAVRETRTLKTQRPIPVLSMPAPVKPGEAVGIRITVERFDPRTGQLLATGTANIATVHAPATKSALDEIRAELASRLEGQYPFIREQSYTDACVGINALAGALHQVIPAGDARYVAGSR